MSIEKLFMFLKMVRVLPQDFQESGIAVRGDYGLKSRKKTYK
jgi:hypothetical protein